MATEYDFRKFNARAYLEDYYFSIRDIERFFLTRYNQIYAKIRGGTLLEIGGGPTIVQLISASKTVDRIVFTDFLLANRQEVQLFIRNHPRQYNFDKFFKYVLKLEGSPATKKNVETIKNRLRKKITRILPCDLRNKTPIPVRTRFDIVSVHFCPESITDNEKEFRTFIKRISSYVKKEGLLVMAMLRNGTSYSIGKTRFPAFPVDEKYMRNALRNTFYNIRIKTFLFKSRTMDGNMLVWARKR